MPRQRLLILAVLVLSLVLTAVLFFFTGGEEAPAGQGDIAVPVEPPPVREEASLKPVVLYFLSEEDGLLHPEERQIVAGPTAEWEARRLVEELIKGSRTGLISPLPSESKLRQVFFLRGGTAVVDFSREFGERHPSGSSAELATVSCVVNSLTRNFNAVKRVMILVNGGEKETLNGHISLTGPFLPFPSMIAE
jgi:spore germination protein GerM